MRHRRHAAPASASSASSASSSGSPSTSASSAHSASSGSSAVTGSCRMHGAPCHFCGAPTTPLWGRRLPMHALALALLLLAAPAGAATIVIDFAEESLGEHGDSFVSAECACVRFSTWSVGGGGSGNTLTVFNFNGNHTLAVGEQGGDLLLEFLVPVGSVRLEFGGDSPLESVESFPAVLVGLSGGEFASIDTVAPNRNRAIDQTLQIAVP